MEAAKAKTKDWIGLATGSDRVLSTCDMRPGRVKYMYKMIFGEHSREGMGVSRALEVLERSNDCDWYDSVSVIQCSR